MENNNNIFKPLVDIDYTGIIRPTCFSLRLGERYLSEILEQLIPVGTSFAGRVRLIVEDYTQSTGIPEPEEKKEETKNESV